MAQGPLLACWPLQGRGQGRGVVLRIAFPINSCSPCRLTVRCQPQYRTSRYLAYKSAAPVDSEDCFVSLHFLFDIPPCRPSITPTIPVGHSCSRQPYAKRGSTRYTLKLTPEVGLDFD